MRRRGESARQQRINIKLVRREVKVAKLLNDWSSAGITFRNPANEFEALMAPCNRALRQNNPIYTPNGTRSSTGRKIATDVPQDAQNNTHRFGGSRAYSARWHEIRNLS